MRTFGRCPLVDDPEGVDVAVLGIPFDTGTTNRPGTRFGPEAVRSASMMLRPYNPVQDELLTRDHFEPELFGPGAPTAVAASNVAYELSTLDVLGARAV